MIKKIAIILISGLIFNIFSTQALALTNTNTIDNTPELTEMFPNFEQSLVEYTNGNKIADKETFVKITILNDDSTETKKIRGLDENGQAISYKSEISTEKEYLLEGNIPNLRANGTEHGNITNQNRWIKLTLQVYEGKTKNQYMAYSFYEWLTQPVFNFVDAHGINFNGMAISNHAPIQTQYMYHSYVDHTIKYKNPPTISNEKGVASKVDLLTMNCQNVHKPINNGMLQVPLSFFQYSPGSLHTGNVFTSYVHAEVNINPGSISLGSDGLPSIAFGSEDRFELGKAVVVKN